MLAKSLWLPLSAVCINSGSTESKLLRALAKEIPGERILESIATVCLTAEQCYSKFLSLDTGGHFSSGNFPSKGCYTKNNNFWFGTGGTDEEMAETNLPGILTRVWCNMEAETLTFTVTSNQPTDIRTKRPTPQPTTQGPTDTSWNHDLTAAMMTSAIELHNEATFTITKRPTPQPTTQAPNDLGWNHGSTAAMTSSNGTIEIHVPHDARVGDGLFLFLSRTDARLPLELDQWTNVAQCFKSSNEQPECLTAADCLEKDGGYCKSFAKGRGRDLGSEVFYHKLTREDKGLTRENKEEKGRGWRYWAIDLEGRSTAWAITVAIAGVNEKNPIRSIAGASCDKESGSAFPSVHGEENDIVLLSQSFDDSAKQDHFRPPVGTSLLGWIKGVDEAGFVFGERLARRGETGTLITEGPGGRRNDPPGEGATKTLGHYRDCKDVMLSLTVNRE